MMFVQRKLRMRQPCRDENGSCNTNSNMEDGTNIHGFALSPLESEASTSTLSQTSIGVCHGMSVRQCFHFLSGICRLLLSHFFNRFCPCANFCSCFLLRKGKKPSKRSAELALQAAQRALDVDWVMELLSILKMAPKGASPTTYAIVMKVLAKVGRLAECIEILQVLLDEPQLCCTLRALKNRIIATVAYEKDRLNVPSRDYEGHLEHGWCSLRLQSNCSCNFV